VTRAGARRTIVVIASMAIGAGPPLGAQQAARPRPRVEARVDYLGPNPDVVHAGVAVNVPIGTYLRVSVVGAGGASWGEERRRGSMRADVLGRFLFDPFRERRWGLSAGGGLSVRYDQGNAGDRWRPLLALVLDLEGPRRGAIAPALQVGLGGGARVGFIIRGADPNRR
jgi:hypothetical protein